MFKSLADNSSDVISVLDRNMKYVYINPAVKRYSDLEPSEFVGKDIYFSYRSEENLRLLITQIKNTIETREPTSLEMNINTKVGPVQFLMNIHADYDKEGCVSYIYIIGREIPGFKSNDEVESTDSFVRASAEALLQPFVILSPMYNSAGDITDFRYQYANEAAVISNGISRKNMLASTVLELFPLHKENGVFDNLKKVYLTSEPWREIVYYYGPAGSNKLMGIFEISAARTNDRLVSSWNDITHLKTTEEKFLKSEKKFNQAFSNSPAAMVMSRMDGEIVDVNKAFEELFEIRKEDVYGRKSTDLGLFADPRDRELLMKMLARDGLVKHQEFGLKSSMGKFLKAMISVVFIQVEEEPLLLSVIVDITDQRNLEDSLKNSLTEKVILLQEVHHRVRNNMQIILSMLNLQRNSINNDLLNEQLQAAQSRIRSMALVYDKLFPSDSYSRINLKHYLTALISESNDSVFSAEVNFSFSIPEDYSIDIEKAIKIGLILNELYTNSVKHAFKDLSQGKIDIAVESLNNHKLILRYSDNGSGSANLLSIKKPGSLGLRLLRVLIEDLNGKLSFQRTENCSRFEIQIEN